MDNKLIIAILDLMHIAECAADVLDKYADLESDGHGGMVPNSAAAYKQHLIDAVDTLDKLMNEAV